MIVKRSGSGTECSDRRSGNIINRRGRIRLTIKQNNKMVKRLLILAALLAVSVVVSAQDKVKKVAVLKVVDEYDAVSPGIKLNLRQTLTVAINDMEGYEAYTRVNTSAIRDEHAFERSGYVSDDEIKELGRMNSVDYVLVAEVAPYSDGYVTLTASIYNVVTGRIFKASEGKITSTDPTKMPQSAREVAHTLLKGRRQGELVSGGYGSAGNTTTQRGQDFTETAFGINMRMVYVEGGTFTMGCTGEQGSDCYDNESPNRQTTVSSYYIGMLEVTQSQWEKVMGTSIYQQQSKANASKTYDTGADYPMYGVSWKEAKEFCTRLSRQTGRNYTLPTEAEWEYAARGGKKNEGTKYSGGWSVGDVAWYDGNSGSSTHPCGTKRPNALGIYDMSGNVWEWCEDWYGSKYLQYDNNNPKGASSGGCRVLRGGCWNNSARDCRVSNRSYFTPGSRFNGYGFRVVLH